MTHPKYVGYSVDPEFFRFYKTLQTYSGMSGGSIIIGTDNPLFGTLKGMDPVLSGTTQPAQKK